MGLVQYIEEASYLNPYDTIINEEGFEPTRHLSMELLDTEEFIKSNNMQEITDPIFFIKDGVPTEKGLLSNEIFGITKDDRANIYAYIDLGDWFMHPLCYKLWSRMDSRIIAIAYGTKYFRVDDSGDLVEDPNGETGIKFLHDNIDKIKIKDTESFRRGEHIKFLYANKKKMFIKKYIVIPPFYRDVNSSGGARGVGVLNKYYSSLLIATRSLKETQDYGLFMSNAVNGRIQSIIVSIYDCLAGTSKNKDDGPGLSKKTGYVRNTAISKTADYGTRLVLSAPNLRVEKLEDLMTDIDYGALPLASALTNFYPFILFYVRRFFDNEFGVQGLYPMINDKGEVESVRVKDPRIAFSDEVIEKQVKRFIHGFSNRFIPVEITLENGVSMYVGFKGTMTDSDSINKPNQKSDSPSVFTRRLTWCDVFYIAAVEATRDKHILITRYPIDSAYNQIPLKPRISSTKKICKMQIESTYYPYYPYIREKDIGANTSNLFVDTFVMSNLHLKKMVGDYDGDQISVKGVYSVEANDELDKFMNSKASIIDFGSAAAKVNTNESIQSLYSLTKILPQDQDKITNPVF